MTVLLAADEVTLYPPGGEDSHGWADTARDPYWCGLGNLQLISGASDPLATAGGGRGPHGPARSEAGTLFLDVEPVEGSEAVIRGRRFTLSQVRLVNDPLDPGGGLSCWAASVAGLGERGDRG